MADRQAAKGKQGMINLRSQRVIHSEASKWAKSSPLRFARGNDGSRRSFPSSVSVRSLSTKGQVQAATDDPDYAPIASQSNGFQHGSTLYGVRRSDISGQESDRAVQFSIRKTENHVVTLWKRSSETSNSIRNLQHTIQGSTERAIDFLSDLFLPRDFRRSVTPDYFPYAKWYFVGTVASAASGVLSMQSLLYAIGLGAGSIPTAAAINWVLKDGLGQFGGVMFASIVNNRYDADPKRWRVASALSLDLAGLIEILTPLFPAYFLPMASLGNVAKNISWLSASATRAGFHNSFAIRENLADLTAKAGSQAIASSIIGTGLGIAISSLTGASTTHVLGAFVALSAAHQFSVYRALACVSLRTLNCQRLHLVADHFLTSEGKTVPHQDVIAEREQFIPTLLSGYQSLYRRSIINGDASLAQVSSDSPHELLRLKHFYSHEKYLLNLSKDQDDKFRIDIALEESATSADAMRAHLQALLVQRRLETNEDATPETIVQTAYQESQALGPRFVDLMQRSEWHTDNLLVEEKGMRFRWHSRDDVAATA
ncbi:hypothetical protein ATCC90586_003543 [Pythium insidiosum]|nr:hypothetical protein ATCC90586_003543 [Pythium insidiosum]